MPSLLAGLYLYMCSVVQSCPTPWTVCSPPGSSVQRILPARILEWVAISYSRGIFSTQGSNPCLSHLLHWQANSLPPYLHIEYNKDGFNYGVKNFLIKQKRRKRKPITKRQQWSEKNVANILWKILKKDFVNTKETTNKDLVSSISLISEQQRLSYILTILKKWSYNIAICRPMTEISVQWCR